MATPPATTRRTRAAELKPKVLGLLPGKQGDVARALDRRPSDGTVRRVLDELAKEGLAERVDGEWRRCQELREGANDGNGLSLPSDFDQESVALYHRTRTQLVEQETWKDSDAPLLERYVRALQDEREYRDQVATDGRFNRTKTGRVFVHPAVKLAVEREQDANVMARDLLLTPESRRRAGRLPKGDGSGPGAAGDPLDAF